MKPLDPRLNAFRPDLADRRLAGQVEAARFSDGTVFHVACPVAGMHARPDASSGMDSQCLYGDELRVFDRSHGWAWVQRQCDSYVGYVPESNLAEGHCKASHIVCVPRSFVYPEPDLKKPVVCAHSMGACVTVAEEKELRGTRYAVLADGRAMIARHLRPMDQAPADFVAVAELFLHTPYMWGGVSGFGIDCSGLVQLSMRMAGRSVSRDTDMQAGSIGTALDPKERAHKRGDLIFWHGHVAILTASDEIIHANGYTMSVSRESLAEAISRIQPLYGLPTAMRRP